MIKATALRPLAVSRGGVTGRLALAAIVLALASGGLAAPEVGDPAPDFTLTGNDDTSYTLSDVYGEKVQMLFFVGYS